MKSIPLCLLLISSLGAQVAETSAARVERFLAAMGGREAWAQVKFVQVEAIHESATLAEPYKNKIWNDFSAPRLRFEARNASLERRRVIDGEHGRLFRDGVTSDLPAESLADDLRWWEANIYRTLHRLAIHDPSLSAKAVGEHRLEIFRADGKRLNWFVLTPRGEPLLFGTWDSENGTAFGPLASNGTVKYPKWGAVPAGLWRYEVVQLDTASAVPADANFTNP